MSKVLWNSLLVSPAVLTSALVGAALASVVGAPEAIASGAPTTDAKAAPTNAEVKTAGLTNREFHNTLDIFPLLLTPLII